MLTNRRREIFFLREVIYCRTLVLQKHEIVRKSCQFASWLD
jgi:hypothetical protein